MVAVRATAPWSPTRCRTKPYWAKRVVFAKVTELPVAGHVLFYGDVSGVLIRYSYSVPFNVFRRDNLI